MCRRPQKRRRQAGGELVAVLAHHDLLLPDHLALLAARFDDDRVEWVYSRPVWVSIDGLVLPLPINLNHADELHTFLRVVNNILASCVMHRRSCFDTYGYWPEDVARRGDWTSGPGSSRGVVASGSPVAQWRHASISERGGGRGVPGVSPPITSAHLPTASAGGLGAQGHHPSWRHGTAGIVRGAGARWPASGGNHANGHG